jgi:hypothetical protein
MGYKFAGHSRDKFFLSFFFERKLLRSFCEEKASKGA